MAVCLFGISSPEPLCYRPSSCPGPSFSCLEYKYTAHLAADKTGNTQPAALWRKSDPSESYPSSGPQRELDSESNQLDLLPSSKKHFSAFQPRISPF